jgi:hypothetical protein
MLTALIERMKAHYDTRAQLDDTGPFVGVDAVVKILARIRDEAEHSPLDLRAFWTLMFAAIRPIPELHDAIIELNHELLRGVSALMAAGLDCDQVRAGTDPWAAAGFITSSLRGIAYFGLLEPDNYDILAELDNLSAHVEAAFRT